VLVLSVLGSKCMVYAVLVLLGHLSRDPGTK
jgi:hypothetical protein